MRLLKIGRDPSCDIVLHSMRASALHAEITVLNNGDIILEDKDSKNGTYIMNSPIKPNTPVNIKRGDTIRFADVELLWDQVPTPEDNNKYKAIYGIGTNFRNEIQVSGNTISRFHATLKIDKKGNAILQDHSKNGTTVNGRRINFGQSIKITKKDAVVCGGIPVNLSSYIPGYSPIYKIIGVAATIIVLLGLAYGSWLAIDGKYSTVSPITTEAIEEATVCVFGGYYYEVTIKDDPFKDIDGIVSQWYVGGNNDVIMASTTTKDIPPFEYSGTAFFISENGELGTNRHIAVPWEYRKKEEEEGIRHLIEKERIKIVNDLERSIASGVFKNLSNDAIALLKRYAVSEIEISGKHAYFGIGLSGSKVSNIEDLQHCQVIAESGDPKKDVALIRLNTPKTPDYLIKNGAIFDIEKARVDENSLKIQQEQFSIIGYPLGLLLSDGKSLKPSILNTTISKTPDENSFQVQTISVGGQSGSPVIDKKHRLVGVLYSSIQNTSITYCCNIKHLKELYDKNKLRK